MSLVDKNGREIKVGDKVRLPNSVEIKTVAELHSRVIVYAPPNIHTRQDSPRHKPVTWADPATALASLVEVIE